MENILIKKITEVIESMNINEQYQLYSEYCENYNLYDDRPERIDCIDDLFYDMKPLEILEKLEGIDLSWDYFNFDGYGHVKEWDGIEDISEVVQEIINCENAFGNDDIKEIFATFSDLETLVNNAMAEIYDNSIVYNYNDLFSEVGNEIEKQTSTEGENLFLDYEEEIIGYIENYIEDNRE